MSYLDLHMHSCYSDDADFTPEQLVKFCTDKGIKTIKENGGVPVFAHPGIIAKEDIKILDEFMKQGIEGIEVYSSYHSKEQIEFYENYAKRNRFILTCGSDFHGKNKPSINIGQCNCNGIEEEILDKILEGSRND